MDYEFRKAIIVCELLRQLKTELCMLLSMRPYLGIHRHTST